jgi:hypothetical protein
MDLLVAPVDVATVIDIGGRRRDALRRGIRACHRLPQRQAGTGVGVHEPDPHPIPVGRRRSVSAARLAVVFDIGPEHHAPGAHPGGDDVITCTREADLVGRRVARFGAADPVVAVTQAAHQGLHVGVSRTREARTHQAVEAVRVEIAEQPPADVPHVRPFPGDARRVGHERGWHPGRCAHLSTMRGVECRTGAGVGRARTRRRGIATEVARAAGVHAAATRHPAAEPRSRRLSRAERQRERQQDGDNTGMGSHGEKSPLPVVVTALPGLEGIAPAGRARAQVPWQTLYRGLTGR